MILEAEFLKEVSNIAKEMEVVFTYSSFVWEGKVCLEIKSSSKPFLATLRLKLGNKSKVYQYFKDL